MPKKSKNYLPLPERYQTLLAATEHVRLIEELALSDPDSPSLLKLLKQANNILRQLLNADEKAFLQYAYELGAKVQQPDYPHSIKTWYEDDFRKLLDEYRQ